ncbi:MAG: hypothetical protein JHD16_11545 [Solirubrobacteraceae bacterium]|nr:hypothetical protein [Solirubrobacteraceae bacterium]
MLISHSAPRGAAAGRLGAWLSGFGFLASAGLAVHVARSGPVELTVALPGGGLLAAWQLDAVALIGLLLMTGLATVIQAFAVNYLRGDRRARRFALLAGALTLTSAAMVMADTLLTLAVAWTLSSVLLCALLGLYRERPEAREGVRRTATAFAIGDAALWAAVAIVSLQWGQVTFAELGSLVDGTTLAAVAAALLVVTAALARSAQLPFQSWLPATLAAPTPVSALLHAGAVNAGGLLLIKVSPLVGAVPAAMWSTALIGAATLVYGAVLMLVRPDVKGALAHSTVAQMGFMVMTCGLGAYAAALVHLVAHGMYKANLFLGSGSAIAKVSASGPTLAPQEPASTASHRVRTGLVAALIPGAALLAAHAALYPSTSAGAADSAPLLLFAWLTGAWVAFGWLAGSLSWRRLAVSVGFAAPAALAYVGLLASASSLVAPSIEAAGPHHASSLLLLPLLLVLGAAAVLRSSPSGLGAGLGAALYAAALRTGPTVRARQVRPAPRPRAWRPLAFPVAVQRQESH